MDSFKTEVYELVQELGSVSSDDIKNKLKKDCVDINDQDLNKALFHLEIQGLISVRWAGKKKRRIELGTRNAQQPQTIW